MTPISRMDILFGQLLLAQSFSQSPTRSTVMVSISDVQLTLGFGLGWAVSIQPSDKLRGTMIVSVTMLPRRYLEERSPFL